MKIKIGMRIHDIYKREWFTVVDVKGDMVYLSAPPFCHRRISKKEFEELYKASPINK